MNIQVARCQRAIFAIILQQILTCSITSFLFCVLTSLTCYKNKNKVPLKVLPWDRFLRIKGCEICHVFFLREYCPPNLKKIGFESMECTMDTLPSMQFKDKFRKKEENLQKITSACNKGSFNGPHIFSPSLLIWSKQRLSWDWN